MDKQNSEYTVRATHCDHNATFEEVYETLKRTTEPLTRSWEKLSRAKRIAIKFNQDFLPDQVPCYEGRRLQLVSDVVANAVIRLLREKTDAELYFVDISAYPIEGNLGATDRTQLMPLMTRLGVPYVNADVPPFGVYEVPGGGQMFKQYVMPESVMQADALVDVQRVKNHAFMGVTLTLKNLFGLVPMHEPEGRARHYYHHLVRMPYMLADINRLFDPALCILDGLLGQAGGEWSQTGQEKPVVMDMLMAGDHPVSTDAVATHLMGHDPTADWLTEPFHRDRNALLVAAEGGFGTVNLDEIDWASEVEPMPEGTFFAAKTDPEERVISWRRTTCEQALYYRDHMQDFVDKYAGQFILLQEGEVKWHSERSMLSRSRRQLAGDKRDQAMFLKYVDPDEAEGEHYEVYDWTLADLAERGL